ARHAGRPHRCRPGAARPPGGGSPRGHDAAPAARPYPLTEDQVGELKQQLRQRLGRDVAVDLSGDPARLGGLVGRIGSQMID
ncbi:F0F1 ATP synthase subunit delta, partial [Campylobacter coli]|nr:F0F1 ATP synthase subunit delta [Campylobacter coli]